MAAPFAALYDAHRKGFRPVARHYAMTLLVAILLAALGLPLADHADRQQIEDFATVHVSPGTTKEGIFRVKLDSLTDHWEGLLCSDADSSNSTRRSIAIAPADEDTLADELVVEGKIVVISHQPTTIDDQHFKGFLEYRLLGRLRIR
jgi:cell division protein FtsL